jgi:hypothetical protein
MKAFPPDDEALRFFRALADANRLRLLGLLALAPHSVEELAGILHLRPSTVSHHLGRLTEAELVEARAESYYSVYALVPGAIESRARRLLARRALRARAADLDLDAYDRNVLHNFLRSDGRLKAIPAQRRKRMVVLRHLATFFRLGRRYRESEVNRILKRFHPDTATLRREMVGEGLLQRAAGEYRRIEGAAPARRS